MAATNYLTMRGMIVHENRGGVERDYVPDTLGSTACLLDSTQTVTDSWEFLPYGEVAQRTGTSSTPFTFGGMWGYFRDLLDKLTYARARYIRPNLSRWLTVDPLWPMELPFSYCRSMPCTYVDPTGLVASSYIHRILLQDPCKGVKYGRSKCEPTTGEVVTLLCDKDKCTADCTELHEGVHGGQYGSCCANYKRCTEIYGKFLCDIRWNQYFNHNGDIFECQAAFASLACAQGQLLCACLTSPECCVDVSDSIVSDLENIKRHCKTGVKLFPCPFDDKGGLISPWPPK
jgi:RHS repeat-associated protein